MQLFESNNLPLLCVPSAGSSWSQPVCRLAVLVALICLMCGSPVYGQDKITVINPDTGVHNQFPGQVIAWDRERITYVSGGRERQISARRVSTVDYPKSQAHLEADRFFLAGSPNPGCTERADATRLVCARQSR